MYFVLKNCTRRGWIVFYLDNQASVCELTVNANQWRHVIGLDLLVLLSGILMGCSHLCPRPSSRHCAADIGCISLPSTSAERKNTRGKVSIKLRVSRPRWLNLNAVSNPINTSANESLTGHSFGAKRELVCNFRSRRHLWHLKRLDKETEQSSQRQRAFRKLYKQTLLFVKIISN